MISETLEFIGNSLLAIFGLFLFIAMTFLSFYVIFSLLSFIF